jgi:hypothetical protein
LEDTLPFALAGSFAIERSVDHCLAAAFQDDAHHLNLRRETQRGRVRQSAIEFGKASARRSRV